MKLQPHLYGSLIKLRPLLEEDFEPLYRVAQDPQIWEQHPEKNRFEREVFQKYFKSGLDSGGALVIVEQGSGEILGSSRFYDCDLNALSVIIGYTFLSRHVWGKGHNRELKLLMLNHAFQNAIETVFFQVGEKNERSQKALVQFGVKEHSRIPDTQSIRYHLSKEAWIENRKAIKIPFVQSELVTPRLRLEPIEERHAPELHFLLSDAELHRYVPMDPPTLEQAQERCTRWASRRSMDGTEIWLNWAARSLATQKVVAHFQAGIPSTGSAYIGYVVSRDSQGQGLATEGLQTVIDYLVKFLGVAEVKAWSDTRNIGSHKLAMKLGLEKTDIIKNADFFKGTSSDEFVFTRRF